jgi:hypothetical protein
MIQRILAICAVFVALPTVSYAYSVTTNIVLSGSRVAGGQFNRTTGPLEQDFLQDSGSDINSVTGNPISAFASANIQTRQIKASSRGGEGVTASGEGQWFDTVFVDASGISGPTFDVQWSYTFDWNRQGDYAFCNQGSGIRMVISGNDVSLSGCEFGNVIGATTSGAFSDSGFLTFAKDVDSISYLAALEASSPGTLAEEVIMDLSNTASFNLIFPDDVIFSTESGAPLTAIPIPAAVWLFGSALGLLGWMRRKAT